MYIIIQIYIFITVTLLIFDVFYIFVMNIRTGNLYPRNDAISKMIRDEISVYGEESGLSQKMKSFLIDDIRKTKNLVLLQKELAAQREVPEDFLLDIRSYVFNLVDVYQRKKSDEQAFYAFTVSLLPYSLDFNEGFYARFYQFLDSKSLFVFSNAMEAFYSFSDPYLMSAAIKKVNDRKGFYHNILLMEGLLRYKGDAETLNEILMDRFYDYNANTQEGLVNYFRLKEVNVDVFCLEILKGQIVENEVLIATMRYFKKNHNQEAKSLFISLLEEPKTYWTIQLLAIQGLNRYDEPSIREVMIKLTKSTNLYIQTSTLCYLYEHELKKMEILRILENKSSFMIELLLYQYRKNQDITQFIKKAACYQLQDEESDDDRINSMIQI